MAAFQDLVKICALPSVGATEGQAATLEMAEGGNFTFVQGAVKVSCQHSQTSKTDLLAPEYCAVLTALDLYWHSELDCVVSLSEQSVIPADNLPAYTMKHTVAYSISSEQALSHITMHYPHRELSELFVQWSSTSITRPIPGLPKALKHYQCPDCML
ncbi:hypothetical protein BKA70DRAFT_1107407, partial [Coprinopsis sp. MPI-PUGE-AT-0042]